MVPGELSQQLKSYISDVLKEKGFTKFDIAKARLILSTNPDSDLPGINPDLFYWIKSSIEKYSNKHPEEDLSNISEVDAVMLVSV